MLKFKFLKKIIHLIGITALTILVFACNQHIKKSNLEPQTDMLLGKIILIPTIILIIKIMTYLTFHLRK